MSNTEEKLLTVLLNISCRKGWLSENETLRIKTKETLNDKKMAMLDVIITMECDDNAARLLLSMRCIHEMNTPELPEGDDNRFLPKIMFNLFEKGLATEEEIAEFEGQLQEEKKTIQQKNATDVDLDDDVDDTQRCVKNPLQIILVIKCILQYLSFQEVKQSRFISKEWASAGLNALIPRSKITFDPSLGGDISKRRGPIQFFKVFPGQNEDNRTFPFSHFIIDSGRDPWPVEELNCFFRNQKQYITVLKLSCLCLVDDNLKKVDSFDTSPWICNSPMAMTNSNKNTKLYILDLSNHWNESAKLSIDSNVLLNVKNLELSGCTVNLQGGVQISPIYLDIQFSRFSRDGSQLGELLINDFVDFRKAKQIHLRCDFLISPSEVITKLSLDLSGCHKLECLDLSDITLINWKTSNWTINELKLCKMPMTVETTQMQIKKLQFNSSEIDISVLPQSLEELFICDVVEEMVTASHPIVFHNLKLLKMYLSSRCFSTFSQNVKCPNLIRLEMRGHEQDDGVVELDVAWLTSTSVKILLLFGIAIKNEESRTLNLDKLVLMEYGFPELKVMLKDYIQTKVLVCYETANGSYDQVLNILETQKCCQELGQLIYVSFGSEDVLCDYKYYVFENNLPRVIDFAEFDKIMP